MFYSSHNYWWKGQNKRTCCVGKFPRVAVDPLRRVTGKEDSYILALCHKFATDCVLTYRAKINIVSRIECCYSWS